MAARPAARGAPSVRRPAPPLPPRRKPAPASRPAGNSGLGRGDTPGPPEPFEVSGKLKKSAQVTLDSSGSGTVTFTPYNARQRWEVAQIVVTTNQAATATPVPVAEVFVNATSSRGNSEGSTSSGSQDTLTGLVEVGACDQLSVVWTGGISGTVATAIVTGQYFTRRA